MYNFALLSIARCSHMKSNIKVKLQLQISFFLSCCYSFCGRWIFVCTLVCLHRTIKQTPNSSIQSPNFARCSSNDYYSYMLLWLLLLLTIKCEYEQFQRSQVASKCYTKERTGFFFMKKRERDGKKYSVCIFNTHTDVLKCISTD